MRKFFRDLMPALSVATVIWAAVAGSYVRERQDFGRAPRASRGPELLASRTLPDIPADEYYYILTRLLKEQYVEPITDEQKLATGAIRGMVGSLMDRNSSFMNKDQFQAFQRARAGEFEGIGIELEYQYDKQQMEMLEGVNPSGSADLMIPTLRVTAVAPGGPAEAAGIRPGDVITSVEGKMLLSVTSFRDFRARQAETRAGKFKAADLEELRKRLQNDIRSSIIPSHAKDKLTTGQQGQVKLSWRRGDKVMSGAVPLALTKVPAVALQPDGVIGLKLFDGAAEALKSKLSAGKLVIDLRDSGTGSENELTECLQLLAPKGAYGTIKTLRTGVSRPLAIESGNDSPPELTLIVDGTTRGPAEILALALASTGRAKLQGGPMAGERAVVETISLPDGSGYTLTTGLYEAPKK